MSTPTSSMRSTGGWMPRSTSDKSDATKSSSAGLPHVKSMPHLKKRALLLEDSFIQRKAEHRVLTGLDYDCDAAPTLSAAVGFIDRSLTDNRPYECVITDHNIDCDTLTDADPQATETEGERDASSGSNKPPGLMKEKDYVARLTRQLFPSGMPPGCAEGIVFLEYIRQKFVSIPRQKPVTVLISAFDSKEGSLQASNIIRAANDRGAHFLAKAIKKETIAPLLARHFSYPPSEEGKGSGTDPHVSSSSPPILPPGSEFKVRESSITEETGNDIDEAPTASLTDPFKAMGIGAGGHPIKKESKAQEVEIDKAGEGSTTGRFDPSHPSDGGETGTRTQTTGEVDQEASTADKQAVRTE